MAEPAAAHLHQHLALARRIEVEVEDVDRLGLGERTRQSALGQDGGFDLHYATPPAANLSCRTAAVSAAHDHERAGRPRSGKSPLESTPLWTGSRPMASGFSPRSPRIHAFCPNRKHPCRPPSRRPDRSAKREAEGPFSTISRKPQKRGPSAAPRFARLRSGRRCIVQKLCLTLINVHHIWKGCRTQPFSPSSPIPS